MGLDAVIWAVMPRELSPMEIAHVKQVLQAECYVIDAEVEAKFPPLTAFKALDSEEWLAVAPPNTYTVNTMLRYYGTDYARGNFPAILHIVMVLERELPAATIYYGADCDNTIKPWPIDARIRLLEFWVKHEQEPYRTSFLPKDAVCMRLEIPQKK